MRERSDGRWRCPNCAVMNSPDNETCFRCDTPKIPEEEQDVVCWEKRDMAHPDYHDIVCVEERGAPPDDSDKNVENIISDNVKSLEKKGNRLIIEDSSGSKIEIDDYTLHNFTNLDVEDK